jgi:hypothetical protein
MTLVETINFWISEPLGRDPAVRWLNLTTDLLKFPETKDAAAQALGVADGSVCEADDA